MSSDAQKVLDFWLTKVGPDNWLQPDARAEVDASQFADLWKRGVAGELGAWICMPETCLSLILLLDQFPRLMFRGRADAYAGDAVALAVAKRAIVMGHDLKTDEPARQFFYMPLMHSESLMDQERCVRLMALRLPMASAELLAHARAHRDIIRQFGRFPYRNALVGRESTDAELAYLSGGGYAASIEAVAAA